MKLKLNKDKNSNEKTTEMTFEEIITSIDELIQKKIKINLTTHLSYESVYKEQHPSFASFLMKNYFKPEEGYKLKGIKRKTQLKTQTHYSIELYKIQMPKKEYNPEIYNPIKTLSKNKITLEYDLKNK